MHHNPRYILVRWRTTVCFQVFALQWKFHNKFSLPHYPQSNSKADATVKFMKKIIGTAWNGRHLDGDKLCRDLLENRNMQLHETVCQKLFGHPMQDTLPAQNSSFSSTTQVQYDKAADKVEQVKCKAKQYNNKTARPLPDIQVRSQVALQKTRTKSRDMHGKVIAISSHCQFTVKA